MPNNFLSSTGTNIQIKLLIPVEWVINDGILIKLSTPPKLSAKVICYNKVVNFLTYSMSPFR
jgi:hypothetical protein